MLAVVPSFVSRVSEFWLSGNTCGGFLALLLLFGLFVCWDKSKCARNLGGFVVVLGSGVGKW